MEKVSNVLKAVLSIGLEVWTVHTICAVGTGYWNLFFVKYFSVPYIEYWTFLGMTFAVSHLLHGVGAAKLRGYRMLKKIYSKEMEADDDDDWLESVAYSVICNSLAWVFFWIAKTWLI